MLFMNVKKRYVAVLSFFIAIVISLSLMITPFIGAYHAISHPIESTIDFVESVVGSIVDFIFDENDEVDMNQVVYQFYDKNDQKEMVDKVLQDYSDNSVMIVENLMMPYVFTQCNLDETSLKELTKYIDENMKDGYRTDLMIDYILSTSPFKEAAHDAEVDSSTLSYLFQTIYSEGNIDVDIDSSSPLGNQIVEYAKSRLGCRYWWGANGPKYFDCSGFVYWTHNQAGISIPRTTAAGYSKMGKSVNYDNLQIGDVITFDYGSGVAHIGIYIGNGQMIHASGDGSGTTGQYADQCVKITSIKRGSYFYRYIHNCRRLY